MNFTTSPPPPAYTERRDFNVPDLGPDDWGEVIFTFHFIMEKETETSTPQVTFTLELNPKLQQNPQSSPPVPPMVYSFDKDKCQFVHLTPENYYIKGTIKIITFSSPVGQFDKDTRNFNFNIAFGKTGDPPHELLGLYGLTDPDNPEPVDDPLFNP